MLPNCARSRRHASSDRSCCGRWTANTSFPGRGCRSHQPGNQHLPDHADDASTTDPLADKAMYHDQAIGAEYLSLLRRPAIGPETALVSSRYPCVAVCRGRRTPHAPRPVLFHRGEHDADAISFPHENLPQQRPQGGPAPGNESNQSPHPPRTRKRLVYGTGRHGLRARGVFQ